MWALARQIDDRCSCMRQYQACCNACSSVYTKGTSVRLLQYQRVCGKLLFYSDALPGPIAHCRFPCTCNAACFCLLPAFLAPFSSWQELASFCYWEEGSIQLATLAPFRMTITSDCADSFPPALPLPSISCSHDTCQQLNWKMSQEPTSVWNSNSRVESLATGAYTN